MRSKFVQFDFAIKKLLRDKANFAVLEGFLTELLHVPIKIDKILESEANKEYPQDKWNRVDILTINHNNNEKIIIELQVDREWDYLCRMLYSTSRLVSEYLQESQAYANIKKIIAIHILYFDLGSGSDYIYRGATEFHGLHKHDEILKLSNKEQEEFVKFGYQQPKTPGDIFPEYYIIKVNQFDDKVKDKFDEWMYFLKNSAIKPEFNACGIHLAEKKLQLLALDEHERAQYEEYVNNLHYQASMASTHNMDLILAKEEGFKRGQTAGFEQGQATGIMKGQIDGELSARMKIAKSLKQSGLTIEEIIKHTKLEAEQIESLKE